MEIETVIGRSDIVRLYMFIAFRDPAYYLVGLAYFPVLYFFGFSPDSDNPAYIKALAAVIGSILLYIAGVVLLLLWVLVFFRPGQGTLGQHVFKLGTEGFEEKTAEGSTFLSWSGVRKMWNTRHGIYIKVAPFLFHVIPRRAFAEQAAFDNFWQKINVATKRT